MSEKYPIKKISIIIPCYNEQEGIPFLKTKLQPALDALSQSFAVEVIFIDDGSSDNTYTLLKETFGSGYKIIKHPKNMNLGAALRTGLQNSTGDVICAVDSDCTYDPMILKDMIALISSDVDIVSAAAFHPKGKIVADIPKYRIFLSKSIVAIYNILLAKKYYSYTCMVRAYKREVIKSINYKSDDFLAMAEIMITALLKGYKVYEFPATSNVRQYGSSKIRLFGVIRAHTGFVLKLLFARLTGVNLWLKK
ncbi:MAG: glycosyltransferase family 2 protein [Candidatus Omnitrophota bacterium]